MRSDSLFLVVVALKSFVSAQLPACAQSCLSTLPSQCGQTDIACICADTSFSTAITCCALSRCDTTDIDSVISFATNLCSGAGITIASTLPTCPSTTAGLSSTSGSVATVSSNATAQLTASTSAPSVGATSATGTPSTTSSDASIFESNFWSKFQATGAILVMLLLAFH